MLSTTDVWKPFHQSWIFLRFFCFSELSRITTKLSQIPLSCKRSASGKTRFGGISIALVRTLICSDFYIVFDNVTFIMSSMSRSDIAAL